MNNLLKSNMRRIRYEIIWVMSLMGYDLEVRSI